MEVEYDQKLIHHFADNLCKRSKWVPVREAVFYGLVLGGAMIIFGSFLFNFKKLDYSTELIGFGLLFGGHHGWQMGKLRAYQWKLEAQRALCFMQMELNSQKENLSRQFAE